MTELSRRAVRWAAHYRARDEMFRPMGLGFGVDGLAKALTDPDDANEAIDEANDTGLTECPHCGFVGPVEAVRRHRRRTGHEEPPPDENTDHVRGEVEKATLGILRKGARPEQRFTLSPLYTPGRLDAHSEWADADDLSEALHDYLRKGYRKLHKQHGGEVIGEVVEAFQWPHDHEAELKQADGSVRKQLLPAGTVYCGVKWTPKAWADVKAGRITGLSMGGTAIRVKGVLPS